MLLFRNKLVTPDLDGGAAPEGKPGGLLHHPDVTASRRSQVPAGQERHSPNFWARRVPQAGVEPSEPGQDLGPGTGGPGGQALLHEVGVGGPRDAPVQLDAHGLGGEEGGGGGAAQVPASQAAVVSGAVQVEGGENLGGLAKPKESLTSTLFPMYWARFT